jgi:hypothetical protein
MTTTATFDSAAGGPAAGGHPDLDRWIAYRAGDTGDEDVAELQDHLAGCRDCTALVLDLAAFADPAAADRGAAVSELERAAAWRALRPRLAPGRRWYVPAALAASLMAAAVGLSGWLQEQRQADGLRRELADLTRPQANVPVHDLFRDATLRSSEPDSALEIPAEARSVTLILNELTEVGAGDELRARILDGSSQVVATVDGLELDELGVATLGLARDSLPSGDYVVRVEVRDDGDWRALGDYPLRLRYR